MNELIMVFDAYPAIFYGTVALFSLMIGSFLNVVIYRMPVIMEKEWRKDFAEYFNKPELIDKEQQNFSLAFPASHCPKCNKNVTWYDNIPVVSWLLLKGACRHCKQPIALRYPLIEALTAALSVVIAVKFGVTEATLWALVLTFVLIALTFIDFDKMLLPDQLMYPLLWLGLILNLNGTFTDIHSSIFGAVFGYLSLWSVYWLFKLVTGKEGMGYGDFKLLAVLGAWLGWQYLPMIILGSSVVGAVIGISIIAIHGRDKNIPIPFGPYLAIAGWLALIWGEGIQNWYFTDILGL